MNPNGNAELTVCWLVKITQNPLGFGRDLPTTNDHFPFFIAQSFPGGTGLSDIFFPRVPGLIKCSLAPTLSKIDRHSHLPAVQLFNAFGHAGNDRRDSWPMRSKSSF